MIARCLAEEVPLPGSVGHIRVERIALLGIQREVPPHAHHREEAEASLPRRAQGAGREDVHALAAALDAHAHQTHRCAGDAVGQVQEPWLPPNPHVLAPIVVFQTPTPLRPSHAEPPAYRFSRPERESVRAPRARRLDAQAEVAPSRTAGWVSWHGPGRGL